MIGRAVINHMLENDAYSQWLEINIESLENEALVLKMVVRKEMANGFGIAHGGISYSLADTALAFISNMDGYHAVSIETSISHVKKIAVGDILRAFAQKVHRSRKIGVYQVEIKNQLNEIVAIFKGTVYISDKKWSK